MSTATPLVQHPLPSMADYRPDIDGLRAIAVLSVLAFHGFPQTLTGGYVGVDIFFVISGFLITGILLRDLRAGTFALSRFYARRARRIFPALGLVLLSCLAIGWLVLLADEYQQLGKHVVGGAAFLSNFVLWSEAGYFDNTSVTKPLLHLWSLGIEEQFYILWPLGLYLLHRSRLAMPLALALILGGSFAWNLWLLPADPVATFYWPMTRLWELLLGGLLAYLQFHRESGSRTPSVSGIFPSGTEHLARGRLTALTRGPEILSSLGALLILVAIASFKQADAFPGWRALVPALGAFLVISGGPRAWLNRRLLSARVLVWFGLISFPLYLWHWPLLSFARIAQSDTPSTELRSLLCLASIGLAWATYRFIERPVRFGSRNRRVVPLLVALMVGAGLAGYTVLAEEGFRLRTVMLKSFGAPAEAPTSPRDPGSVPLPQGGGATPPALLRYLERLRAQPGYVESLEAERQRAIRAPYCHLNQENQSFTDFKRGIARCLAVSADKRNVLVIGDSHGGDFFAALASTHREINVLQATGQSCTPISARYAEEPDRCGDLLAYAMAFARDNRLDAVILAGLWGEDYEELRVDIERLKSYGQRVILVGPPLEFTTDVSRIIDRRGGDQDFDRSMSRFIRTEPASLSRRMQRMAAREGVSFLDRTRYYCQEGCPVLNGDGELLIRDYGHLTAAGARYLGEQLLQGRVIETLLARPRG